MTYLHFIGIDVSKESLEVALYGESARPQRFPNSWQGLADFAEAYHEELPNALVVCEATGRYEQALISFLLQRHIPVHRASGARTSHYARSLALHGKTDAIDARILARYAAERHEVLLPMQPQQHDQMLLETLMARREDILAMKVAEQQRKQHPRYALCKDKVQKVLEFLCEELADIEEEIETLIAQQPEQSQRRRVMVEMPGIGQQVSLTLLAFLPELGTLTRREVASLSGLAPHPRESGKYQGYRATRGGRKAVKRALFMAAQSASKTQTVIGEFYRQLVARGKKPIVALIATARKIITILNAKLKEHIKIQPNTSW